MPEASCMYVGEVQHCRFTPTKHAFRAPLFMMYLDLAELTTVFQNRWFWSAKGFNLAWFRRADHCGVTHEPLENTVRNLVKEQCGVLPSGPIRLLTHLRYFGYVINPISVYYCFDSAEKLEFIVCEVTNTPWGERHCYVLDLREQSGNVKRSEAVKLLHVSPFFGMDYQYHFQFTAPLESLAIHIENHKIEQNADPFIDFSATLSLHRKPISTFTLAWVLCRFPLITAQVFLRIYWEAWRLWMKRVPYVQHPSSSPDKSNNPHRPLSFRQSEELKS